MRITLVILFLLCGVGAFAESQPPAPSTANPATQPKGYTSSPQNASENDKPTTKNFPPIIEISKAPVIQVESTEKTEKRRDYSSSEWWLVYITGLLALITGTLAWYTSRLYKATVGLGKDAIDLAQRNTFNDAADGFFFHFHNALHDIEGSSPENMIEFDKVFINYYDSHMRAIREFKRFLCETDRTEIDKAWNSHCWDNETGEHEPGSPPFLHYMYGGDDLEMGAKGEVKLTKNGKRGKDKFLEARQLALDNINKILSFAKIK